MWRWAARDNAVRAAKSSAACWVNTQGGHGKKREPIERSQMPTKKVASAKKRGAEFGGDIVGFGACQEGKQMARASRVARVKGWDVGPDGEPKRREA